MPVLGRYQYLLDIVFFLYPDEKAAREGRDAGGTGFFVTIPSATYPEQVHHLYAVTNWHVAVQKGCSVIRVNLRNGGCDILPFEPHEWEFIPGGADVAVLPLLLDQSTFKAEALVANSFFLTEDETRDLEINAAEDVFMLGRFIDYDGVETNQPSMRFGNISMMSADVKQPNGCKEPSLVVDMHSRTGYSGSPVFVYRTAGAYFTDGDVILSGGHLLKLLGILWGQFPETWDIGDKAQHATPTLDGKGIKGMSGMSLVCPASSIWKVLHTKDVVAARTKVDESLHELLKGAPEAQA